jgi:hypothetical protein
MGERKNYEDMILYNYIKKRWPNCLQWRKVRLGPIWREEILYKMLRRWADAVVYDDKKNEVIIIEADIRPDPGALSKLVMYKSLFKDTPEFEKLKDKQIRLIYLTTMFDQKVAEMAKTLMIDYEVYVSKVSSEALEHIATLKEKYKA